MNPSYCRVRILQDAAWERFAAWRGLPRIGPLAPTDCVQAVRLACDEQGRWRRHAVLVSKIGGWTLFSDQSGTLSGIPADGWRTFAQSDELVFAGYDDAIAYGEFVWVRGGRAVHAFFDDACQPDARVNIGNSDCEGEPFSSWADVDRFVDGDELGFCGTGLLWVWRS